MNYQKQPHVEFWQDPSFHFLVISLLSYLTYTQYSSVSCHSSLSFILHSILSHSQGLCLSFAMAQKFEKEGAELAESPRPPAPQRQESLHPGLRPSVINVPVTPGIDPEAYTSGSGGAQSYFAHNISKLRETMAQSPSEAADGAKSGHEILRRMSLTGNPQRQDTLNDIDPRAANPSLSLSGSVISATFCIPHSLQYRKGSDWVSAPCARLTRPYFEPRIDAL